MTILRSLAARLAAQPVATDKAVQALAAMAVGLGWIHLSQEQVGLILAAYSTWSVVLVWQAVTPNATAAADAQQAADTREAHIAAFLDGAATAPPRRPLKAKP